MSYLRDLRERIASMYDVEIERNLAKLQNDPTQARVVEMLKAEQHFRLTGHDAGPADIEAFIAEFADLGVSHGYVGNCGPGFDDRSWRIFTKLATRPGAGACNVSLSIDGPYGFSSVKAQAWLERQRERLAAGELHRVGNWWKG